jgi:hypothetical protein
VLPFRGVSCPLQMLANTLKHPLATLVQEFDELGMSRLMGPGLVLVSGP